MSFIFVFFLSIDSLKVYPLDTVRVEATRYGLSLKDTPSSLEVIEIDDFIPLSDYLFGHPGVEIRKYGGLTTFSVRGAPAEGNLLLLEGMKLNLPQNNTFNLDLIPQSFVDKIEIVKSGGSSLWGADAMGGIFNFRKKYPSSSVLKVGMGSFGRKEASTFISQRIHNFFTGMGAEWKTTRNDYPYYHKKLKRINADENLHSLYFTADSYGTDILFLVTKREAGVPGPVGYPTPNARIEDWWTIAKISTSLNNTKLDLGFNKLKESYHNPDHSIDDLHTNRRITFSISRRFWIVECWKAINYENISSTAIGDRARLNPSLSGMAEIRRDSFFLYPSLRWDFASDYGNFLSTKMALLYKIHRDQRLYGNLSADYRAPTFNELYWPEDAWAKGNPNLKPEKLVGGEVGIRRREMLKTTQIYLDISFYLKKGYNVIQWMPAPQKWMPLNIREVLFRGVDLILWGDLRKISFKCGVGKLLATDRGYQLPYRPRYQGWTEIEIVKFFGIKFTLIGERPEITGGAELSKIMLFDIFFKKEYNFKNFSFQGFFGIFNLLDKEYQYIKGYPLPGREIKTGLKIERR